MAPRKKNSLYLDHTYEETHQKIYSRKHVISERYIDYESFPKYQIEKCFSDTNMITNFLHISGSAPIEPVLLFYSQIHNISMENQSFDTYIGGNFLGLDRPSKPVHFPPTNESELIVPKDEFTGAVYLPKHVNWRDHSDRTEIKVAYLKPMIKVLVRICQANILPTNSHLATTNLSSIYLSFLLLHGHSVDISYVIWHTMARVSQKGGIANAVPYGIMVGRLLSYLGHPIPDDTPCSPVPKIFDAKALSKQLLPFDPQDSNGELSSEPHCANISAPPPPPPSIDSIDHIELQLPDAAPIQSSGEFVRLSDSIQSVKYTLEIFLSGFEQQHEEFMQQKKMIEHIAHRQAPLEQQQHEEFSQRQKIIDRITTQQDRFQQQQQEMIGSIARQQDYLEQQHEEFKKQQKIIDDIATRQDGLEQLHVEFEHQQKMIDRISTQQDRLEQKQKKRIYRIARQQERIAQHQDQYHAFLMQYVHRAYPDEGKKSTCQKCGGWGYAELFIFCSSCQTSAGHRYCFDKLPKNGDNEAIWTCEDCEETAELESQQGVQVTSSKEVTEDNSNSRKKQKY
ncbi:hypothetical protein MKW92_010109 [Papaver armeniacum]|nr:hypothetical protein MKW92_010109 [Papaver armeniacum]